MREMTDAELVSFMGIGDLSPEDQARFIAGLSQERRALFDRMANLESEVALWKAGLAPRPRGAILCGPRRGRRRA